MTTTTSSPSTVIALAEPVFANAERLAPARFHTRALTCATSDVGLLLTAPHLPDGDRRLSAC